MTTAKEFPKEGLTHYVATWDIDIWAANPRDAAKLGWEIMHHDLKASIVTVTEHDTGLYAASFDFSEPLEMEQ